MKRELFAIENAVMEQNYKSVFRNFNMFLYEGDICGIICDSIIERNMLVDFFRGRNEIIKGEIRLEHRRIKSSNAPQMLKNLVSVIGRDSKLIDSLSIMENICIFTDRSRLVHKRQYGEKTKEYFELFQLKMPPDKQVQQLTEKERVELELIKAYAEHKKMIVLADLSGFLQNNELSEIHNMLEKLQKQGCSFILIESFDDIVFNWTNQLMVIKNGKNLGCFEPRFVDRQKLYDFLVGKKPDSATGICSKEDVYYEEETSTVFRFEQICTKELNQLSFSVDRGGILKIYFMNTNSMEDFKQIFFEGSRITGGRIYLDEREAKCGNIREWKKNGLCYSSELPYKNMLIENMTVRDNLMLDLSEKVKMTWLRPRYGRSVDQYIESAIGPDMAGRKLRNLPPDVLQKIQLGRYYLAAPKVLICEKPFQEVDLHIKEVTLSLFSQLRRRGIAIIVLTTNLSDLNLIEGDNLYIRNADMVDENEIYQSLYSD